MHLFKKTSSFSQDNSFFRKECSGKLSKLLLIMRLTVILLTVASLHVSAKGFAQQVTLSEKNAKLEKVFKSIKDQTGYVFFYDQSLLQMAKPVTIKVKNASLETVLNICFQDQPLSYSIVGTTVVVKLKQSLSDAVVVPAVREIPAPIDITGRVTDKDGNPLQGANITVKGKKVSATTDASGMFILKGVSTEDEIIISYTGYKSQTFKVGNRASFNLALEVSTDPIDQVQVIAYGK